MPGPEEFRRDIRAAKRFGLMQGLLVLLSLFSLMLAVAFAVGGDWREAAVTAGICAVFTGVLVCLERRQKRQRQEASRYYTFPLPHAFDYETVCAAIEAAPGVQWTHLCDETARICRIEGAFSWRVALLHQPEFSASACKAQRERANLSANRAHPEKQEGPQWEIASRSRVNLVVCDTMNDALSRYIGTHAQHLLSRNESIINMAVVGNSLLIPPVRGADVDFPSLNRYSRSAGLIWSLLCKNPNEPRTNL